MKKIFIILLLLPLLPACNKQDEWLDIKSNKADVIPSTLADLQAILDNDAVMTERYSFMGGVGADNYFITDAVWQSLPLDQERNAYIWVPDIYNGETGNDWTYLYRKVEYTNIVLDQLEKTGSKPGEQALRDNIKGSALFYRAYSYYNLLQLFAKPYDKASAALDKGIILRQSSDVNERSERANVEECYRQVLNDLKEAEKLLPITPVHKTRPSKLAALALLARVYLTMEDYALAHEYSNATLLQNSKLIDFNSLTAAATYPFPTFQQDNKEVLFYGIYTATGMGPTRLLVLPELYNSYHDNDLRKSIFYRAATGGMNFKGYYTGTANNHFAGIAVNELYLIRAEAAARLGNKDAALTDLNILLSARWKKGTFTPQTAATPDAALLLVLSERRKELPYTGLLRWEDLRRLNKDPRFAKQLTRTVNGQTYTLPPNDKRYVYPVPDEEIALSGVEQNLR